MKSLVIFYSYGGNTREEAQAMAASVEGDLFEVRDTARPSMVGAFLRCASARGMKPTPVQPLSVNLEAYDDIIIMAPVWAGFPAPAIYNVFNALPQGRNVEVYLVSGGGTSACREKIEALVAQKGCTLSRWRDIKKG